MQTSKKNQPRSKNFYFSIYESIRLGLNPTQIALNLGISKQKLNYYISHLKRANCIIKLGYGTWQSLEFDYKEVKKCKRSKKKSTQDTPHQPKIRGHAFQFKLIIPKIPNWDRRREFLYKNKINYKVLKIVGKGERIFFRGRKVWLTNKSIIIYEKHNFISESAKDSKNYAIYTLLELIRGLESLFKVSFRINKQYKFKVSKQHYSKLNCELAKQYRKDGDRLYVSNKEGVWLITDYSLNIDETETIHPKTADNDMDKHIIPFFNGLKEVQGYTPQFVMAQISELIKDRVYFAENMRTHVDVVRKLGKGVEELIKTIKELKK